MRVLFVLVGICLASAMFAIHAAYHGWALACLVWLVLCFASASIVEGL